MAARKNKNTDPGAELPSRWDFPGWGTATRITDLGQEKVRVTRLDAGLEHKLSEWKATAICGNDITSSCLYVAALSAIHAGKYAPVALLLVAGVLFLFRKIYAEVGTALPLNGGAYNVLLNTTTKGKAAVAACLTLLSYVATAVISSNEGMHYAANLIPSLNIFWATVGLLGFFAFLNLIGITESAVVALGIFIFHIVSLVLLIACAAFATLGDLSVFAVNWSAPPPGNLWLALFFGFSAAMLGISGFESSANFIEEQKPGVFPKTLRNMWVAVAVFNPLISLMALGLVRNTEMGAHKQDLLAHMGALSGGEWLRLWISVDAVLVLAGAVLTSYVGVTGLVRRMSLDRILPQILLRENSLRRTNHWIVLLFLVLCTSILYFTHGDIEVLAGVYTISFLGVMALFAIGNMLLKVRRARLPREFRAGWGAVVLALLATLAALVGNIVRESEIVKVFAIYFAVAMGVVTVMFLRIEIMRVVLAASRLMVKQVLDLNRGLARAVRSGIHRINSQKIIFFAKGEDLEELNRAALYVLANEQTKLLEVVHCYTDEKSIPKHLAHALKTLDKIYPQLRIDLILVRGEFGPELIEKLSRRLGVAKNYMFIATPGDHFPHEMADLGGVRLIM